MDAPPAPAMKSFASVPADPRRRVLFVINDLGLGGAQRVVLHQATFLDPARFVPEVASFEFDPSGALIPAFERAGIPVHLLRQPRELPIAGWARLDRLLRDRRPHLVHTHLAAAGVLGRLAARRRGVPRIVTTLHNLSDWEEKRVSLLRWFDRRTLSLAHAVVTVSDAVRAAVERVSPQLADRTVTVRNGVPIEELVGARAERDQARAALGFGGEEFVVGTVARFDPRKGLDTLVDALALAAPRNPRLRGVLVGDGPERARLEERARARGVEDLIRVVRNPTRVRTYLSAMDLFAAPSRTEGLGMAIIEALAAGIPVLGSRVGGIPEVVQDGVCGRLLPADRPDLWGEALSHFASHPEELERWARAAPQRARQFSLEASGAELESLYDRLLGTHAGPLVSEAAA